MKQIFLIAVILICSLPTAAQKNVLITGKVVNKSNGDPVFYASISVVNKSIGTVANNNGEFEFRVPEQMANDSLLISSIGFASYKEKIATIVAKNLNRFELVEQSVMLGEIEITDKKITARDVIESAIAAVPQLYPSNEYIMEGFYRSWERVEFVDSITYPGTLAEAALRIYDPGYRPKLKKTNEEVYITELRRSLLKETWNYSFNYLMNILSKNEVKYPAFGAHFGLLKRFSGFPNDMVYSFEGTTKLDEEEVIIVKVAAKNERNFPAYYTVYVSLEDYAILRFELNGKKDQTNFAYEYNAAKVEHIYIFKRFNQKVFLNYAKVHWITEKADRSKKKLLQHEHYFSELLINNIIVDNVKQEKEQLGKKTKANTSLELQAGVYNEAFWKNYNIIKKNPLDKEIKSYFEKEQALEVQFKKAPEQDKNKPKNADKSGTGLKNRNKH